ncbi:MAG: META domain-containing protein [Actinobacteria bacterium]|nr:META domain-containing protein [Actinomycetota bacterium]
MKRRLLAPMVMLLLAACLGSDLADSVEGSWVLESGTLHGEPIELLASHPVTLDLGEGSIGGTAACNGYQGEYRVSGPEFELVEGLAVTEMACGPEEVMTTERRYLDALLAVDTVSLDNGELILSGAGSDVELIFTTLEPAPVADLVRTVWVLQSLIEGEAVTSVGGAMFILWSRDDQGLVYRAGP